MSRHGSSNFTLVVLCFCVFFSVSSPEAAVLPGIDVLSTRNFDILQNKRVGLITNHTGRTASGTSTIDIIHRAAGVRLTALFSPEHGIRGDADEKVSSGHDTATGLPIHSLYGTTCRPTPEMLKNIDVLVYDIQDIGTRFYTYIGTLSLAMRAARDAGIPFVVLDRPNPLGGILVQGAIPTTSLPERKSGCGAITSIHPIPTRHGMTAGELAQLFNKEYGIGCDLTVIPMQGWRRSLYYDQTGLPWINPSPNMRSLDAAILYPGPGTLETTNLSVARGTERAFTAYGAPWVDGAAVAVNLARRKIPGITFEPCSFTATTPSTPHVGKRSNGVCIVGIDRRRLDPVLAGLHMLQAFYETHPKRFMVYEGFGTETGDKDTWRSLTAEGWRPERLLAKWGEGVGTFRTVRERYLLYKE